jgi:hypothetical protein
MSECLLSSLASFDGSGTARVFRRDEKAMGIAEATITHDLLDGQMLVRSPLRGF